MKKRGLFLALQQLAAIGISIMIAIIMLNSHMVTENLFGEQIDYKVSLFDSAGSFENSALFSDMFRNTIQDITSLSVIKSQLETDGAFDGSKKINVTEFVNKRNKRSTFDISAVYRLDDLIKWGKYGVELQEVNFQSKFDFLIYFGYENALNNPLVLEALEAKGLDPLTFFNESFVPEDEEGDFDNLYDFDFMDEEEAYNRSQYLLENSIGIDAFYAATVSKMEEFGKAVEVVDRTGQEIISLKMLVPRYNMVMHNQSLSGSCTNWEEYCMLESNVIQTIDILATNYKLYQKHNDMYSGIKSNIKFLISTTSGKETQTYSNVEEALTHKSYSEQKEYFMALDQYVIYSPDNMNLITNSAISEEDMFESVRMYEYAFSEDTNILIGIDLKEPMKQDHFYAAGQTYQSVIRHVWQIIIFTTICLVAWLLFWGYNSTVTGKFTDSGNRQVTRLYTFDKVPMEIFLGMIALFAFSVWKIYEKIYKIVYDDVFFHKNYPIVQQAAISKRYAIFMIACLGLYISLVFCLFWYSFVRRFRCKRLWKTSYSYGVMKAMDQMMLNTGSGRSIIWSTLMPYNFFLLSNLICILGIYQMRSYEGSLRVLPIIVLVLLDSGVGYLLMRKSSERNDIMDGISKIKEGDINYVLDSKKLHGENKELADSVNNIGDGIRKAVATSMKDERMKADLITNVSHDIKTPLTSIINYVDLLKREKIEQEPVSGYIEILDAKAQRLKQLTDDLVEASKISSGNIILHNEVINVTELVKQSIGEFSEKLEQRSLQILCNKCPEEALIYADSRRMWRIMENLFNNLCKYAMENTKAYVEIEQEEDKIRIEVKNISRSAINVNAEELTERFVRGDSSRTSEGSGLGLSIAKSLTEIQNGTMQIMMDGDLFKVILIFPVYEDKDLEMITDIDKLDQ